MEDNLLKKVKKKLNWRERVIVIIFKKTIKKIYSQGVKKGFNWNY